MKRAARYGLAIFWVALLVVSWLHYRADLRRRVAVDRFVRTYAVAERRPAHEETIHFAPTADLAAEVAADVALQDALGSVNLSDVDPRLRQIWIDSVSRYDDELADARALLLEATRARPGWPYHRALLGEVEFIRARRARALDQSFERWLIPLRSALAGAPGEESFATFTGRAMIEAWPALADHWKREAQSILRTALRDPQFVRTSYLDLIEILGHDPVFALLPSAAPSLKAAIDSESEVADVEAVSELFPRWEEAEWREREADLGEVKKRARMNDAVGLRRACAAWVFRHRIEDFDTGAGRRQLSQLLELWPDEPGSWRTDRRADLILFFLDGRTADVDARALASAAASLTEIPRPVAARAALLAGDSYLADTIVRSSDTARALEWTRYYVELARHHLQEGRIEAAAVAIEQVSPAARNECDVAVARAAVDRAKGKLTADGKAAVTVYPVEHWSRGLLPVCVAADGGAKTLTATFEVKEIPALLSYGFDRGRLGTRLLPPGRSSVTVPMAGRGGRSLFWYSVIAGGEVQPVAAALR